MSCASKAPGVVGLVGGRWKDHGKGGGGGGGGGGPEPRTQPPHTHTHTHTCTAHDTHSTQLIHTHKHTALMELDYWFLVTGIITCVLMFRDMDGYISVKIKFAQQQQTMKHGKSSSNQ